MVYHDSINITWYIQGFLAVSQYHKLRYTYILLFSFQIWKKGHSKRNVKTGCFLNNKTVEMHLTILFHMRYTNMELNCLLATTDLEVQECTWHYEINHLICTGTNLIDFLWTVEPIDIMLVNITLLLTQHFLQCRHLVNLVFCEHIKSTNNLMKKKAA